MSQRERPQLDPATTGKKKWRWLALFGGSTLWISILVHVFFAAVATYVVVEHFTKKHVDFHATEPPAPPTETEHKVQLAKKNNVESAPPDLKRITTTALSPIALPDVPVMPKTDEVEPSPMAGEGELGQGMGGGPGGGGVGGGVPVFGAENGTGLEGYFYDLKQKPQGGSSGLKWDDYYSILRKYLDRNWDNSILDRYFKSEKPLYLSRLAIPTRDSADAPKAFGLAGKVQPSFWAVHYHGKVSAPEGDYTFLGMGDNVLVVRIGGVVVLDGGYTTLVKEAQLHVNYPNKWSPHYSQRGGKTEILARLKHGVKFHMNAGEYTDMDVLIGDDGGICCFYLLMMKEGGTYQHLPDGTPEAPYFQLDSGPAPTFNKWEESPPHSEEPEPWQNSP